MKSTIAGILILLLFISTSCKNNVEESGSQINENEKTQEAQDNNPTARKDTLVSLLLGEWKEQEYPFRQAHFKNSSVKFIEEGIVEAPTFKAYQILDSCPFENNNIRNSKPGDLFLVLTGDKRCEKIEVTNKVLTLSGFNVVTDENYEMVYEKVE